ncbi:MAG: DUF370 domain-containing protein [Oscillospiraceae bacterium]|nr:DUF370 domain-containing protein [Oscillospiraceae bacterium]
MYLHLGQNVVVPASSVVGVFDMDNSTSSKWTVAFLNAAQRDGRLINVCDDLPKSFVVCRDGENETVYLSQLAPSTLLKRSQSDSLDF